jgi:hypothetical protein
MQTVYDASVFVHPANVESFSEIYLSKLNTCNFQFLFPVNRIVPAQTRQSVNREHTRLHT